MSVVQLWPDGCTGDDTNRLSQAEQARIAAELASHERDGPFVMYVESLQTPDAFATLRDALRSNDPGLTRDDVETVHLGIEKYIMRLRMRIAAAIRARMLVDRVLEAPGNGQGRAGE